MKKEYELHFANKELFERICGIADSRIPMLEELLGLKIVPRGHSFLLLSEDPKTIEAAAAFFTRLQDLYPDGAKKLPEEFDLRYLYRSLHSSHRDTDVNMPKPPPEASPSASLMDYQKQILLTNAHGRKIYPRTLRQAEFVASALNNEITICIGPAGTGKTFLSTAAACRLFQKGEVERIVLTRPAVEAGESLGYLPGDLTQKVDPYLRPLFDALYECLGPEKVSDLIDLKRIEVAPLAFMRGRTLNDSAILLDEAQNCTRAQLKMFLTRLGRNSRMCIGGDITQIDLPSGKSGLLDVSKFLREIEGVGVVRFAHEDIIRNPLVEKIVAAFERSEEFA